MIWPNHRKFLRLFALPMQTKLFCVNIISRYSLIIQESIFHVIVVTVQTQLVIVLFLIKVS